MLFIEDINIKKKIILLFESDYVVGRKNSDIIIENDASISRKHSVITFLKKDNSNYLKVIDSSKYGTYTNGTKVCEEYLANVGDVLTFGIQNSKYLIQEHACNFTTSLIDPETMLTLKNCADMLGITIHTQWNINCDFLVMNQLSMTPKVLMAITSQKYIVTPDFIIQFSKLAKQYKTNPNNLLTDFIEPKNFLPKIKESALEKPDIKFEPNEARKLLFTDKMFIFNQDSQYGRFENIIKACGGSSKLIKHFNELKEYNNDKEDLYIVVQPDAIAQDFGLSVKSVSESDICLAILTCSTQVYCNSLPINSSSSNKDPLINGQEIKSKNVAVKSKANLEDQDMWQEVKRQKIQNSPKKLTNFISERPEVRELKMASKTEMSPRITADVWLNSKISPPSDSLPTKDYENNESMENSASPKDSVTKPTPSRNADGWLEIPKISMENSCSCPSMGNAEIVALINSTSSTGSRKFRKAVDPQKATILVDGIPKIIGGTDLISAYSLHNTSFSNSEMEFVKHNAMGKPLNLAKHSIRSESTKDIENCATKKRLKEILENSSEMRKETMKQHNIPKQSNSSDPGGYFNFSLKEKVAQMQRKK